MSRLSDIALVTQVAVFGNKRAFDQLVRENQSPVRRFFLSQTLGNEALSDDLAQDTFIKAYTNISQFRGTSSFLTWLMRIAYNVWYDHCRKAHPQPLPIEKGGETLEGERLSEPGFYAPPLQGGDGGGSAIDLASALAILKEEERACVTLQLMDGYAINEIADIMTMPVNTVKSHLKRGKEKMANYLRQNGYDR